MDLTNFKPKLKPDVEDMVTLILCERILTAVADSAQRNDDLDLFFEYLNRVPPPKVKVHEDSITSDPGCDLVDPLILEHFLQVLATLVAAVKMRPYWYVESEKGSSDPSAPKIERWLTYTADENDFVSKHFYDILYICLRDRMAPVYIGWKDVLKPVRSKKLVQREDYVITSTGDVLPGGAIVEPGGELPDVEYDEVPFLSYEVSHSGLDVRVLDLKDFYTFPANCPDIDRAEGVGHIEWMQPHELLAGIKTFGYDKEAVLDLIRMGPTHDQAESRALRDDIAGTTNSNDQFGYYEIFVWHGKMPLWMDGDDFGVPEHLRDDEFIWVICPRHQKVLRWSYSQEVIRPYAPVRFVRTPNSMDGESIPGMLGPHQEEATAHMRNWFDSVDLMASPVMKVTETNSSFYGNQKIFPGARVLVKDDMDEIMPLEWSRDSALTGPMIQGDIRARARELVTGGGWAQLQSKVRKNAEVQSVDAAVSSKFDLYLSCSVEGLERIALLMLAQYGAHMPAEGSEFPSGDTTLRVLPVDVKRRYKISPRATGADTSPKLRLDAAISKIEQTRMSPIYQRDLSVGDLRSEYKLMADYYAAVGVSDPESFIGNEPPGPDVMQLAAQMIAQVMEAAGMPMDPNMLIQSPQFQALIGGIADVVRNAGEGGGDEQPGMGAMAPMQGMAGYNQASPLGIGPGAGAEAGGLQ